MKKNKKFYNMIFPPYLLMVFVPWLALLSLVGNFILDSIVLVIIMLVVLKKFHWQFYKKNVIKVWLFGLLADFIGIGYLLAIDDIGLQYMWMVEEQDNFLFSLMRDMHLVTFYSEEVTVGSVCFIVSAILLAAVAIFVFNYFIVFNKVEMTKKQRLMSALAFSVFTAPYTFLLPSNLFY